MRLAQTACKFEGLYLCHQFFYDLMSLSGALSLNVVKKRDRENGENGLEGRHPRIPQEALQIASTTNVSRTSVKGGSNYILMALGTICFHFHIIKLTYFKRVKIFLAKIV